MRCEAEPKSPIEPKRLAEDVGIESRRTFSVFLADQVVQQLWADGATDITECASGFNFLLNGKCGTINEWGQIHYEP